MPRPIGDFVDARQVAEPGCNATAFAQIPGQTSLFIGRQLVSAGGGLAGFSAPNDCSGGAPENERAGKPFNRWGLTLSRFDWETRRFTLLKPLLDTSLDRRTGRSNAVITGGALRGAIIRSAYDPSVVRFGGRHVVMFECTIEDERAYGVAGTSSCLSFYDPATQTLDMRRTTVLVTGTRSGSVHHAAAVPRLMAFGGRLYAYWSALTIRENQIVTASERGAELIADSGGTLRVKGAARPFVGASDPASTEVWGPTSGPMNDSLVNVFALAPQGDRFRVYAALGGSRCAAPSDASRGCFRLAVVECSVPLAERAWNRARAVPAVMPTNPQEYSTPVHDPSGRHWLLGHFVRPQTNGYSERNPAPSARFWKAHANNAALILFPIDADANE